MNIGSASAVTAQSSPTSPLLRLAPWVPWVVGGAFIVCFAIRDFLHSHGLVITGHDVWGRDFVNVWTGGQLVRHGLFATIADVNAYQAYQRELFGPIGMHNYSYPPVTFPLAAVFSYLPYPVALVAWEATGALFFWWAAKPWWPRGAGPAWLAILTPAALVNLWAGHYGFFIGGLFLLGWRNVELGRRWIAGLCFGLMLVKPHLAILVPLVLVLRREWVTIIVAALTAGVMIAASIVAYGVSPWVDFLFSTSRVQAGLIDAKDSFFGFMSTSPATALMEAGARWPVALCVQAAVACFGIWLVIAAAARGAKVRDLALLSATATFLVLPYAFNYDLTVPMFGALTVLNAPSAGALERRLALYGFMAPQLGFLLAAMGLPVMPLLIIGLAYAQFRIAVRPLHPNVMAVAPAAAAVA